MRRTFVIHKSQDQLPMNRVAGRAGTEKTRAWGGRGKQMFDRLNGRRRPEPLVGWRGHVKSVREDARGIENAYAATWPKTVEGLRERGEAAEGLRPESALTAANHECESSSIHWEPVGAPLARALVQPQELERRRWGHRS